MFFSRSFSPLDTQPLLAVLNSFPLLYFFNAWFAPIIDEVETIRRLDAGLKGKWLISEVGNNRHGMNEFNLYQ